MSKKPLIVAGVALTGLAAVVLFVVNERDQMYYGTVLKESGTFVDRQTVVVPSVGALGDDSVKIERPTYAIQFQADFDNRTYTFEITDSSEHRLNSLSLAIESGTKIGMTQYNFYSHLNGKVGRIYDSELYVFDTR